MAKTHNPMYYSFDFGGVHILSMNTEITYDDFAPGSEQYKFIEDDLKKANDNRHNVPWIIVQGHRPVYSLEDEREQLVRKHIEPLMLKYKVDIGVIHLKY
jgi:acid phosphatase type 7